MNLPKASWLAIAVVWVAAIAGFWFGTRSDTTSSRVETSAALRTLLATSFKDLAGQPQTLGGRTSTVQVVNFWATWCPPCREEMPVFSKVASKYAEKGVSFTGIALDEVANIQAYQRETPVSYPLWVADTSAVALTIPLGNAAQALPFTAIIDRTGKLAFVKLGRLSENELEAALQPLLKP